MDDMIKCTRSVKKMASGSVGWVWDSCANECSHHPTQFFYNLIIVPDSDFKSRNQLTNTRVLSDAQNPPNSQTLNATFFPSNLKFTQHVFTLP
jgi:hypothetical protein